MVATVEVKKYEKKPCNQSSLAFEILLPTSGELNLKTPVRSKLSGGSHFDYISVSYKELYNKLLEAQEVVPYYVKPWQPPYPNWYNINVRCEYYFGAQRHSIENCTAFKYRIQHLLGHGVLEFEMKGRPSLVTDCPIKLDTNVFKGKGISGSIQELKDFLKYEAQVHHLRSENDKLNREIEAVRDGFQKISQAFKNAGIGNTPEEWATGVTKLKNDVEQWRKNCKMHEGRAKKFSCYLQIAEKKRNTTVDNLGRYQAENQMLYMFTN